MLLLRTESKGLTQPKNMFHLFMNVDVKALKIVEVPDLTEVSQQHSTKLDPPKFSQPLGSFYTSWLLLLLAWLLTKKLLFIGAPKVLLTVITRTRLGPLFLNSNVICTTEPTFTTGTGKN